MKITLSSHSEDLHISAIQKMLSKVYWSPNITENEIVKGIKNSALAVGAYIESGDQIGFLRIVSDKVRFAYMMDVVVREDYRRQGIGRKMVDYALAHPELRDVYQWLLITADAHGVYERCGFEALKNPERWMSIMKPRPARPDFTG